MPHLSPITIRQFLRELGSAMTSPATIMMGGTASLVVRGLLSRAMEDVDIVDEVPTEIRAALNSFTVFRFAMACA